MLETIFDIAETIFSVGMGVLNKTSERNTKRRTILFQLSSKYGNG